MEYTSKGARLLKGVIARQELARVFGQEWADLTETDRVLIVRDCTEEEKGLRSIAGANDYAEYRRNIGPGNLAAYALVMRARFNRGAR